MRIVWTIDICFINYSLLVSHAHTEQDVYQHAESDKTITVRAMDMVFLFKMYHFM